LTFDDISFSYPIKDQTKILKNFQLTIGSGTGDEIFVS